MLFVDVSEFVRTRNETGIQRVIKEFMLRAVYNEKIHFLVYNIVSRSFEVLPRDQILPFTRNVKTHRLTSSTPIDLLTSRNDNATFLDLDTAWNAPLSRQWLYPRLKVCGFTVVTFIYDLIPILFPHYMYAQTRQNFSPFLQAVFDHGDRVLFDSESARNDFRHLQSRAKAGRIIETDVVRPGGDFTTHRTVSQALCPKPYLLFVGTIEPRKGHALALDAFERLHEDFPHLHMVFAGRYGWNVSGFMRRLENHPLYINNIHHYSDVDDATLARLYENAFVVLYLSKYEGFGLPVVESLYLGNVTIVSKNSALVEAGGACADYIDSHEADELVIIITDYITNEKKYDRRRRMLKKCGLPLWSAFYEKVCRCCNLGS